MNDATNPRPSFFARRIAAAAFVVCVSAAGAQTVTVGPAPETPATLIANVSRPLDLAATAGVNYSSSTSSVDAAPAPEGLTFAGAGTESIQPPPRRRYGRPRYNDSSHNPDGSNKYAFVVGAGLTAPVGDTHSYLNTSYGIQVGAGRNFNKNFSLMLQFDYDHFGFTGQTLYNQGFLEGATQAGYALDGSSHVWSFTLNPVYNIYASEGLGAYVVGGVGFYHKTANFTIPATGYYQDYFGNIYQYQANQTIDKYTSNAPGFSGGLGLTYKPSRFAGEKLFVEARYVYVENSDRFGITAANEGTPAGLTYTGNNIFPYNSHRTSYIPIKAGIRF